MVVENPLSDEQMESLETALDEYSSGNVGNISVETHDGSYDYKISFDETKSRKMRSVTAKIKWHDSQSDWEIGDVTTGRWLS